MSVDVHVHIRKADDVLFSVNPELVANNKYLLRGHLIKIKRS